MTRRVITVGPETLVREAARLMTTHRVSGLPVVDGEGRVVGIVSDGDLILRQRRPKARPWWRSFFVNPERTAREYRKTVGLTVGDVMTSPAVVISPVFEIETAAGILDARDIRRLPVVRDGRLVGIVTRGDLMKALAGTIREAAGPTAAADVASAKSTSRPGRVDTGRPVSKSTSRRWRSTRRSRRPGAR